MFAPPPPPPPPGAPPPAGIPPTRPIAHNLNQPRRFAFNFIVTSIQRALRNIMAANQMMREDPVQRLGPQLFTDFRTVKTFRRVLADALIDYALAEDRSRGQTLFRLYQRCNDEETEFAGHITAGIRTGNLLAGGAGGWDFQDNNLAMGPIDHAMRQINAAVQVYTVGNPRVMHRMNVRLNHVLVTYAGALPAMLLPVLNVAVPHVAALVNTAPNQLPNLPNLNPAHIDVDQRWNADIERYAPLDLATRPTPPNERRISKKFLKYDINRQDPYVPGALIPFGLTQFNQPLVKTRCCAMKVLHNRPTQRRCENYEVIGIEYCWWHLEHIFNLTIKQTQQRDVDHGTGRLPRLGVFAKIVANNVRMPGNVTFQEWQANPALRHSQPVFARGEFIMYLKGVTSTNPIIQNTFAMRQPGGAVPTGRSYYQVRLPPNHPERITNTRSVLDSSMIRSVGSLVQHSFLHSNCEPRWITRHVEVLPPAVPPPPVSFMALIATQDIYENDEILIFKGADFLGNPFRPNDEPVGIRYKTYQRQRRPQGLWHKTIHPVPLDPIVHDGGHMGQRYDRRAILGSHTTGRS